jgi:hypothetical protein
LATELRGEENGDGVVDADATRGITRVRDTSCFSFAESDEGSEAESVAPGDVDARDTPLPPPRNEFAAEILIGCEPRLAAGGGVDGGGGLNSGSANQHARLNFCASVSSSSSCTSTSSSSSSSFPCKKLLARRRVVCLLSFM